MIAANAEAAHVPQGVMAQAVETVAPHRADVVRMDRADLAVPGEMAQTLAAQVNKVEVMDAKTGVNRLRGAKLHSHCQKSRRPSSLMKRAWNRWRVR